MYRIVIGASSVSFRDLRTSDVRYVPPCEITTVGSRRNFLYVHAGNEILHFDADRQIDFDNGATQAIYDSARGVANNWVFEDCAGGAGGVEGDCDEHIELFTDQTIVVVTHNLGDQYPNVEVLDDALDSIEAHIDFTNVNTLTVTMNPAATGRVVCRACS